MVWGEEWGRVRRHRPNPDENNDLTYIHLTTTNLNDFCKQILYTDTIKIGSSLSKHLKIRGPIEVK